MAMAMAIGDERMSEPRLVVGTESPSVTVGRRIEPQQGAVWHGVELASRRALCGASVAAIFDDMPWQMGATSMLCQGCILAAARG